MTEYDFSPEAYNKFIEGNRRIAQWVDNTSRTPQKSPEAPPTPADHNANLPAYVDSSADRRRSSKKHHRRQYTDSRISEHYRPPSPVSAQRPPSSRHRSASYSQSPHHPSPVRSKTYYPQPIPMAREYSGQSSQTSASTQVYSSAQYMPHSASMVPSFSYPFPQQHYPDYNSVRTRLEPSRTFTAPAYTSGYPTHQRYPSSPAYPNQPGKTRYPYPPNDPVVVNLPSSGQKSPAPPQSRIDVSKFPFQPQLPFSAYETVQPKKQKQLPLLKRLFTGFGIGKSSKSTRSAGIRTPEPSPTASKPRKRRNSSYV